MIRSRHEGDTADLQNPEGLSAIRRSRHDDTIALPNRTPVRFASAMSRSRHNPDAASDFRDCSPPAPAPATIRSRHEGDTVDLLQAGRAAAHTRERGLPQEAGAARLRRHLDLAYRLARRDQLAQLVVEQQRLGDGAAPAVAAAPALPAP